MTLLRCWQCFPPSSPRPLVVWPRLGGPPHKTINTISPATLILFIFAQRLCIDYIGINNNPTRNKSSPRRGDSSWTVGISPPPSSSFHPSPLTDLTGAPYWLLACHGSVEIQLDFQNHLVWHLQQLFGTHQSVAYHTPSGRRVDCFISKCYDLPWPVDCIYILGYTPLSIAHQSIHTIGVWEWLECHNRWQRVCNDSNQQEGD